MKRFQKTRDWVKEHKEGLAIAGAVGGLVALYGAALAVAIKVDQVEREEYDKTLRGVLDGSKIVLPNRDGSFVVLDKM